MPFTSDSRHFPQLCHSKECTGCSACVNACQHGALSLKTNEEGFYQQFLDKEKCTQCLLCETSCPIKKPLKKEENEKEPVVFAAWHHNEEIRKHSSSGGAFTAIASEFIRQGGKVAGAAWGDNLLIHHIIVDTEEDLYKLRLSKYAQSYIGNIYTEIKKLLLAGEKILFSGTPCQITGLKSFLRKPYKNLFCIDIICHGVPSPLFLKSYQSWLQPKYGNITKINFRDKRKGWYDNLRIVYNTEGKCAAMKGKDDAFWIAFNRNSCLMETCYKCHAQGFPRSSDITLADFWRIGHHIAFPYKEEIEKGISMIVVNNPQWQVFIENVPHLTLIKRTFDEAIEGNKSGVRPSKRPFARNDFYKDLKALSEKQFHEKYLSPDKKEMALKIFREYLPFTVIKFIRMLKQK